LNFLLSLFTSAKILIVEFFNIILENLQMLLDFLIKINGGKHSNQRNKNKVTKTSFSFKLGSIISYQKNCQYDSQKKSSRKK
jgi:hypothetical protein